MWFREWSGSLIEILLQIFILRTSLDLSLLSIKHCLTKLVLRSECNTDCQGWCDLNQVMLIMIKINL